MEKGKDESKYFDVDESNFKKGEKVVSYMLSKLNNPNTLKEFKEKVLKDKVISQKDKEIIKCVDKIIDSTELKKKDIEKTTAKMVKNKIYDKFDDSDTVFIYDFLSALDKDEASFLNTISKSNGKVGSIEQFIKTVYDDKPDIFTGEYKLNPQFQIFMTKLLVYFQRLFVSRKKTIDLQKLKKIVEKKKEMIQVEKIKDDNSNIGGDSLNEVKKKIFKDINKIISEPFNGYLPKAFKNKITNDIDPLVKNCAVELNIELPIVFNFTKTSYFKAVGASLSFLIPNIKFMLKELNLGETQNILLKVIPQFGAGNYIKQQPIFPKEIEGTNFQLFIDYFMKTKHYTSPILFYNFYFQILLKYLLMTIQTKNSNKNLTLVDAVKEFAFYTEKQGNENAIKNVNYLTCCDVSLFSLGIFIDKINLNGINDDFTLIDYYNASEKFIQNNLKIEMRTQRRIDNVRSPVETVEMIKKNKNNRLSIKYKNPEFIEDKSKGLSSESLGNTVYNPRLFLSNSQILLFEFKVQDYSLMTPEVYKNFMELICKNIMFSGNGSAIYFLYSYVGVDENSEYVSCCFGQTGDRFLIETKGDQVTKIEAQEGEQICHLWRKYIASSNSYFPKTLIYKMGTRTENDPNLYDYYTNLSINEFVESSNFFRGGWKQTDKTNSKIITEVEAGRMITNIIAKSAEIDKKFEKKIEETQIKNDNLFFQVREDDVDENGEQKELTDTEKKMQAIFNENSKKINYISDLYTNLIKTDKEYRNILLERNYYMSELFAVDQDNLPQEYISNIAREEVYNYNRAFKQVAFNPDNDVEMN